MEQTAEFFREKAGQCRELAEGCPAEPTQRGLEALALEFDACALAVEASAATAREIERSGAETGAGALTH